MPHEHGLKKHASAQKAKCKETPNSKRKHAVPTAKGSPTHPNRKKTFGPTPIPTAGRPPPQQQPRPYSKKRLPALPPQQQPPLPSLLVHGLQVAGVAPAHASIFSRMLRRRVPVLRLGSRGPGGDQQSLRLCSQSVCKHSRASESVGKCCAFLGVENRRNAELSSLFTLSLPKVSTVTGIRGVVVAKRRTVVTFGPQVSTVTRIGGVVVAKGRTVVTFGPALGLRIPKVSKATGMGGVVVAKGRTVITFGLASGRCV